jgi:hypothetical protein
MRSIFCIVVWLGLIFTVLHATEARVLRHTASVGERPFHITYNADETRLYVEGEYGFTRVYDTKTMRVVDQHTFYYDGMEPSIEVLEPFADQRYLLVTTSSNYGQSIYPIRLIEEATQREVSLDDFYADPALNTHALPRYVVDAKNKVILNRANPQWRLSFTRLTIEHGESSSVSPAGKFLLFASDKKGRVFRTSDFRLVAEVRLEPGVYVMRSLNFSPGDRYVVYSEKAPGAALEHPVIVKETGDKRIDVALSGAKTCFFSDAGDLIFTINDEDFLVNPADGRILGSVKGVSGWRRVTGIAGNRLALLHGCFRMLDRRSGKRIPTPLDTLKVTDFYLHDHDRRLLAIVDDRIVDYDIASGKVTELLSAPMRVCALDNLQALGFIGESEVAVVGVDSQSERYRIPFSKIVYVDDNDTEIDPKVLSTEAGFLLNDGEGGRLFDRDSDRPLLDFQYRTHPGPFISGHCLIFEDESGARVRDLTGKHPDVPLKGSSSGFVRGGRYLGVIGSGHLRVFDTEAWAMQPVSFPHGDEPDWSVGGCFKGDTLLVCGCMKAILYDCTTGMERELDADYLVGNTGCNGDCCSSLERFLARGKLLVFRLDGDWGELGYDTYDFGTGQRIFGSKIPPVDTPDGRYVAIDGRRIYDPNTKTMTSAFANPAEPDSA